MSRVKILVAGVGSAGARIVDRTAEALAGAVPVAAIDTDGRTLAEVHATAKIQIGMSRTGGFGSGGDAELGRMAAEDDLEMVRALLTDVHLAILVAGLGGGTGSGATPVIVKAAQEAGATTLCVATLPFDFEGPQRKAVADRARARLRDACDALVAVPNERLVEVVGDRGVPETFARTEELIGEAVSCLCKLITRPGYIRLGFADLRQVISRSGGACTLGYGSGRGADKAQQALAGLLKSPLLEQGRVLESSRCMLVGIQGGADLTVKEITEIMKGLSAQAAKDCHISMGTVIEDTWNERLAITVVASEAALSMAEDLQQSGETESELDLEGETIKVRRKAGVAQAKLQFDAASRGRFKDIEPTILDGEDLDIPTFVRKRIPIEK